MEEQIAATGNDRQVADLIDDEEGEAAEEPDLLAQGALTLGFGERADEITERGEVDAASGFDGLHAERQRQMALAGAGRAEEVYDLATIDELQLGAMMRFLSSEGWKEKSKPASVLIVERRAIISAILMRRFSRSVSSSASNTSMASMAVISPRSRRRTVTSRISIARRHLQADQGLLDAVDERGDDLGMGVHLAAPPWLARCRATAS